MDPNPYSSRRIDDSGVSAVSGQDVKGLGLVKQASGAILWGACFSIISLELVFLGVVLWLPLLIWRESVRTKKYGFAEGGLVRLCAFFAVLVAAYLVPLKVADQRVDPLSYHDITLEELGDRLRHEHGIPCRVAVTHEDVRLSFSTSQSMSVRDVMEKLKQRTNCDVVRGGCGNGATLLFGAATWYHINASAFPPSGPALEHRPGQPVSSNDPQSGHDVFDRGEPAVYRDGKPGQRHSLASSTRGN